MKPEHPDLLAALRRSLLSALPMDRQALAEVRFDRHVGALVGTLQALYGKDDATGFDGWLGELLQTIGQCLAARPAELLALDEDRLAHPDWFLQSRMLGYCAYVDRFAGTLDGVRQRVPYLRELGVTYLHLLPFLKMQAGDNDGGFAVASFEAIEPRLGTMADLDALTAQLRASGISLCGDFVLNHVASDHPWAQAALRGEARYRDYFHVFPDRSLPDAYEAQLSQVFPEVAPGNFTAVPALGGWVWSTFYPYQWDLNYGNRAVFADIAKALLGLANHGVEVFRLDSSPFLWKRPGTSCVNQPEVHLILQALRAVIELAAPGVLLKAEAIVPTAELPPYFGSGEARGHECHLAYHSSLMAAGWAALAEQRTDLLARVIDGTPELPSSATWLTYVRCHDDIVWSTLKPEIAAGGESFSQRLTPVSRFLAGEVDGSFARGQAFQTSAEVPVFGSNGMTAALTGLSTATTADEIVHAERRIRLLYALALSFGGLPLIYMGDELGQGNDESDAHAALRDADGRWLQRPLLDTARWIARDRPGSPSARIHALLRELVQVRKQLPMLAADQPRRRLTTADPALLVLARGDAFVAVMNFSALPKTLPLSALGDIDNSAPWSDAFTGQAATAALSLAPWDLCWLVRQP